MANVLFVVPPLHGHTNPTIALGAELAGRGHRCAWTGIGAFLDAVLPEGSETYPVGGDELLGTFLDIERRSQGLKGITALKFFWEEFLVPLADAMVDGVDAAVAAFGPDVVVVDQQTVAGALVARRRRVPFVTSATTSGELVDPFAAFPKLAEWADGCLEAFQRDHGVPEGEVGADRLRFSDDLVLAFTSHAFVGGGEFPPHWAFVGPAFGDRPGHDPTFPWELLDAGTPTVLVSLGTVNAAAGGRFYGAVAEMAASSPYRFVLAAPPEAAGDQPPNVLVRARVPQVELLGKVAAVVCHAGHNTVCEALAHGLPLVVAPIRDDQPVVAAQVTGAGVGVRVRYGRVGAAELGEAVRQVVEDPAYRERAGVIRRTFEEAGGVGRAAGLVEALIAGRQAG